MSKITSREELQAKMCSCTETLKAKFEGTNGKRAVVLCGGTGCLSSNSAEILAKIQKLVEEKGLSDRVTVNQVGCFGYCSQGPFVKIFPEDTLYRLVQIEDVEEIVEKDLIGGEVVERLLFVEPETGKPIGNDLREGKITLPLIEVLEKCSPAEKLQLLDKLSQCKEDESAVDFLQGVVEATGGLAMAARTMQTYIDRATAILATYADSPYRTALVNLCAYIAERDR